MAFCVGFWKTTSFNLQTFKPLWETELFSKTFATNLGVFAWHNNCNCWINLPCDL